MNSQRHLELKGQHALFSPSQSAWLRYDDDQFVESLRNKFRAELGTEIHEFASHQIKLGNKQNGVREIVKGIQTQIFNKYYKESYDELTEHGVDLLTNLKYVPAECYGSVKSFINDAIGYRMKSEEIVYYSRNFFGTSDAIIFYDPLLRIHDLKTGIKQAGMDQLAIYAALYCLEHSIKPETIEFELRIYQNDTISTDNPDPKAIRDIMDIIIRREKLINRVNGGKRYE